MKVILEVIMVAVIVICCRLQTSLWYITMFMLLWTQTNDFAEFESRILAVAVDESP